jgi:multiple sugar transport system substrate-binding protein
MNRWRTSWILAVVAALLVAAGCGGGSTKSNSGNTGGVSEDKTPVTITLWHPWTGDEKKIFESTLKDFSAKYPWITVKAVGFPNSDTFDDQVIRAVKGGNPPDAVLSFGPDYDGQYCSSGLMQDLSEYMNADKIPISSFAPAAITYTKFAGKQCTLPSLTDSFGLYYNKDMLDKAGISPPKTMSELAADAKKLTVRNPDGTIKIAGFVPLQDWEQLGTYDLARMWGAKFLDDSGQPVLADDPAWTAALEWQKSLIDWYGYDNLVKFNAAYGGDNEFSASNAFETGKVAMTYDGEWRTAFIKREHPELNYGTAFFPAADDHPELYGSQRVGGTVVGIPQGSDHPDQAWLLVKYLSTDTHYLVTMANQVGNVPTTQASASSPDLKLPPQFKVFIDVWNNPQSSFFPPITTAGRGYYDPLGQFVQKWEAGKVSDLHAGLQQVDQQISDQLALGGTP